MLSKLRHKVSLLILIVFISQDLFSQCAMCKAVAEDAPPADGGSLNAGILYIMIIPYIILFFLFRKKIFHMLREIKNAKHS